VAVLGLASTILGTDLLAHDSLTLQLTFLTHPATWPRSLASYPQAECGILDYSNSSPTMQVVPSRLPGSSRLGFLGHVFPSPGFPEIIFPGPCSPDNVYPGPGFHDDISLALAFLTMSTFYKHVYPPWLP
jgi:hypothetical protein